MARIIIYNARLWLSQNANYGKRMICVDVEVANQKEYDLIKQAEKDNFIDLCGNKLIISGQNG